MKKYLSGCSGWDCEEWMGAFLSFRVKRDVRSLSYRRGVPKVRVYPAPSRASSPTLLVLLLTDRLRREVENCLEKQRPQALQGREA